MRINWFSNAPWGPSGYSNQTALFVPRIKDLGHEMSITAFWGLQGGRLDWHGVPVFSGGFDAHGQDIMGFYAKAWKADILLTLYDTWVMNLDGPHMEGIPFVPWFPVDHEPMPQGVYDRLKRAMVAIAYSKSGVREAKDRGLDVEYVPHGVDTNLFKPKMREIARKQIGLPQDCFIASIVAMNKGIPPRKAWPQQLQAFSEFHKKHPDSKLYLHTLMTPEVGGYNLWDLVKMLGLEDAVVVPEQFQYIAGYPPEFIADVYNASDVLMSATMGEGFGIPIIEAQACGTPVIAGGWTAMEELVFAGWKIDRYKEAIPYITQLAASQYVPSVDAIVDRLEQAYDMSNDDRMKLRETAREGALQYDADLITEKYWVPTLKVIEDRLVEFKASQNKASVPVTKGTGAGNRAQRRRQARKAKKDG
jgi:glycosyltransferase involved in cell wall biosynthesis